MSRTRASSLGAALDWAERLGETPQVNPSKKVLPTPTVTGRDVAILFVLTLVVLWLIVGTAISLQGESAPFIYSEF